MYTKPMNKRQSSYSIVMFKSNGYSWIKIPKHPNARKGGWVLLHRWLMEKKIRRFLRRGEVVHHLNEIKQDNRIENLQLLPSKKEHALIHASFLAEKDLRHQFFSDINFRMVDEILRPRKTSLFDEEYYHFHTKRQLKKLGVDKNRKS